MEFASAAGGLPGFLQPGRGRGKTVLGFRKQKGQGLQVGDKDVCPGPSFSRNEGDSVAPAHWAWGGGLWPQVGAAAPPPPQRRCFTRSSLGLKSFAFLTNSQQMLVPWMLVPTPPPRDSSRSQPLELLCPIWWPLPIGGYLN